MEVYLPPIAAVTGGIVLVGLCFLLRIPIFIIGFLSAILLIYTLFIHKGIFGLEYKTMNTPEFYKANAPIFIILAVIIIALGYILYLFGPKGAVQNASILSSNSQESRGINPSSWFGSKNTQRNSYGSNPYPQQRNSNRIRSNSNPSPNSLRRRELEDEISRRV